MFTFARSLLFALGLALLGCASDRPEDPKGPEIRAEILAPGLIRMDGQEVPTEAFLDSVRQRVAAAGGQHDAIPCVTLIATTMVRNTSAPARVFEALRSTGVRDINLEVDW